MMQYENLMRLIGKLVGSFDVYISKGGWEIRAETENYEDIHILYLKELKELANGMEFDMEPSIVDDELQLYFQPKISSEEIKQQEERLKRDIQISFEETKHREEELTQLVKEIKDERRWLNNCFLLKFDIKFLRESDSILDLTGVCENEDDFTNRILTLARIVDEINYKEIKEKLGLSGESINILESILKEHFSNYDREIIENLREIRIPRSEKYQTHTDTQRFLKVLKNWGFSIPPEDWNEVYTSALKKYLESIRGLRKLLS